MKTTPKILTALCVLSVLCSSSPLHATIGIYAQPSPAVGRPLQHYLPQGFDSGTLLDQGNRAFDIRAYGATTGAADNHTAIVAAITAAGSANPVIYIPAGTWRTSQFSFPANCTVWGAGRGVSIIKALNGATSSTTIVVPSTASNVTLRDLTIDGNRSHLGTIGGGVNSCIFIGGTNVLLENVEITHSEAIGAFVGDNSISSENVSFVNCWIHDNGGTINDSGIGVGIFSGGSTHPTHMTITGCLIENNYNTVTKPGDSTGLNLVVRGVIIKGNRFRNNYNVGGSQMAVSDGGDGSGFVDAVIADNEIIKVGSFGTPADQTFGLEVNGRGFAITGNVINGFCSASCSGINIEGFVTPGQGTITGNYISNGHTGIRLYGFGDDPIAGITVSSNVVHNVAVGMDLNTSNNRVTIMGNDFSDATTPWAIYPSGTIAALTNMISAFGNIPPITAGYRNEIIGSVAIVGPVFSTTSVTAPTATFTGSSGAVPYAGIINLQNTYAPSFTGIIAKNNSAGAQGEFGISNTTAAARGEQVAGDVFAYATGNLALMADGGGFMKFAANGTTERMRLGLGLSVGTTTEAGAGNLLVNGTINGATHTASDLSVKPAIGLVATSNLTLSGAQTVDGVLGTAGQTIVLCTAQSTGSQNGPWVMQSGAWTRPTWYANGNTNQAFQFITCFVRLGTNNAGHTWRCTTSGTITIDTTATTWVETPYALTASGLTGIVSVVNGGTGQASYTDGQLLIGNTTGNTLTKATLSGTANQVLVTNGSGAITLSLPQSISTGSSPTFAALTLSSPLTVPNGGNGLTTATLGDVRYGSGTNTIAILAGNTTTTVKALLQTGNGTISAAPAWTAIPTSIAGTSAEITASASTGSITLSLPSSLTFTGKTITGGTYSGVSFTASSNTGFLATGKVQMGDPPGSGYPGIWFGANTSSPNYTNYGFLFDAANGTILNAASGLSILMRINNSNVFVVGGTSASLTGDFFASGLIQAGSVYRVGATQVVGARDTGWTAMTGSPDKATSYATSTVTLAQLAGRVAQLQASLTAHGLIGP